MGYSSTVITSRAFQAAMLVPQNRHCQPIIADSLLPKNRKKQQTAEINMEPPVREVKAERSVKAVSWTRLAPTSHLISLPQRRT